MKRRRYSPRRCTWTSQGPETCFLHLELCFEQNMTEDQAKNQLAGIVRSLTLITQSPHLEQISFNLNQGFATAVSADDLLQMVDLWAAEIARKLR